MPTGVYKRTEYHRKLCNTRQGDFLPYEQLKGGYQAIHKWLTAHYGKANKCENEDCKGVSLKFHWAKKQGCKYDYKRENFLMLCISCHRKYDITKEQVERMRATKKSQKRFGELSGYHKLNWKIVGQIRALYQSGVNGAEIAKKFGISYSSALNIIKKKQWPDENYQYISHKQIRHEHRKSLHRS